MTCVLLIDYTVEVLKEISSYNLLFVNWFLDINSDVNYNANQSIVNNGNAPPSGDKVFKPVYKRYIFNKPYS